MGMVIVVPMKFVLSSPYGEMSEIRGNVPHNGIDIPMEVGTKLRSFVDGTVERIVDYGKQNIGKGVVVRGDDGNAYIYGHMSKITVKQGQHIHAGQDIIGMSGNTGNSTGPHLHFGIQAPDGHFIDPTPAVKALESVTGADPLGHYIGGQPLPGSWMDKLNHFADNFIHGEKEHVAHPFLTWVGGRIAEFWHEWFIPNLPDIMGYGAMLAGACMILSSMTGKNGMIRPLAVYAGCLIVSLCILSAQK